MYGKFEKSEDWFKRIMIDTSDSELYTDDDGNPCGRIDVDIVWNDDVEAYRRFSIRQYNNDSKRGTDRFCLKAFLNWYDVAINVFNIHAEMNAKHTFNTILAEAWRIYNGKKYDV